MPLQPSACSLGYTDQELVSIFGERLYHQFKDWMVGKTITFCNGQSYNHQTLRYEDTKCSDHPHGHVTYASDVERFLKAIYGPWLSGTAQKGN